MDGIWKGVGVHGSNLLVRHVVLSLADLVALCMQVPEAMALMEELASVASWMLFKLLDSALMTFKHHIGND